MQEFEMKYVVPKEEFYRLLKHACRTYKTAKKSFQNQINFYYDTAALDYHRQNITLRVRQKGTLLLLQKKCHTGSGILISTEEERIINSLPIKMLYKNVTVHLQGQLRTQRYSVRISDSVKIEYDINDYLGMQDFEIEIEFLNGHEAEAKRLAALLGLHKMNRFGKSARFFHYKGRLCKNAQIRI